MTPTSNVPLAKVLNGAFATAAAVLVLALVKHYLWVNMPADMEGALNVVILAVVTSLASLAAGYITKIQPGEITATDTVIIEQEAAHDAETQPIEALK